MIGVYVSIVLSLFSLAIAVYAIYYSSKMFEIIENLKSVFNVLGHDFYGE